MNRLGIGVLDFITWKFLYDVVNMSTEKVEDINLRHFEALQDTVLRLLCWYRHLAQYILKISITRDQLDTDWQNAEITAGTLYLFGHLHFTKNQAVCSWFRRQISNQPTGQTHHFFGLEIQIYYTHFFSIFCSICQIHTVN